jgi:DNA-binding winged helix-turn-helix (wHTH) protein
MRFGRFELDVERRLLWRDTGQVRLTRKAFDLLALLVDEAPRVVRKDELHERLWQGTFVSDATLVGLIKEVRRALDDRESKSPLIRTAHGVGYAFAGEIQRGPSPVTAMSCWVVVGPRRIALGDGEHVIGRAPASALHLDAAGISRLHARIVITAGNALIEDLSSKNGTLLNDEPVVHRLALHDGDRIRVGPVLIVYHASATGMTTETIVTARK